LKGGADLAGVLRAHLSRLGAGDYFAVLSYITMNAMNEKSLQTIRHAVRDKKKVATVLASPRFLHSTDKPTKAAPIAAFSCRLLATTPRIFRPRAEVHLRIVRQRKLAAIPVLAERGRRALRVHWEESEVRARHSDQSRAKSNC